MEQSDVEHHFRTGQDTARREAPNFSEIKFRV